MVLSTDETVLTEIGYNYIGIMLFLLGFIDSAGIAGVQADSEAEQTKAERMDRVHGLKFWLWNGDSGAQCVFFGLWNGKSS